MPRLPRSPLTAAATAALVGSVVLGGGAAWAAWSVSGTGAGTSAASSLVTPVVTATRSTTSPTTAIDLSWTASGQLPGTTYSVTRNGTTIACSTSPCTDSGLTAGTSYTYSVTPKVGSWTGAAGTASASTQAVVVSASSYALSVPTPVTAGTSALVTIFAKRPDGTTDTGYVGTKSLSWSDTATAASPLGAAASLPGSATFADGQATVSITLTKAGSGLVLTVASDVSGSATIQVNAGAVSRLGFTNTLITKGGVATPTACLGGCTVTNLGNNGRIDTRVTLIDDWGNASTRSSSTTITFATSGQGAAAPTPTTMTIPALTSESTSAVTVAQGTAYYSTTLTATSTPLTSVSATISK